LAPFWHFFDTILAIFDTILTLFGTKLTLFDIFWHFLALFGTKLTLLDAFWHFLAPFWHFLAPNLVKHSQELTGDWPEASLTCKSLTNVGKVTNKYRKNN
jgi:hypothetical protein